MPITGTGIARFTGRQRVCTRGRSASGAAGTGTLQEVTRVPMEREHQRTDSHRRLFVFSRFWRLRITMLLNQMSMRTSLTVAVMVVGLLGVFFVYTSGDIYRDVSLAQQRTALGEQVKSRISDLRRELDAESQRFVLLSRQESGFVNAAARCRRPRRSSAPRSAAG